MAAALGINQAVLFTSVFALGSFLAGLGGALAMPREPANLALDLGIIADVFVVTVVGGLGSIPGAYVAAIIVSVVKAWCIGLGDVHFGGDHDLVLQADAGRGVRGHGGGADLAAVGPVRRAAVDPAPGRAGGDATRSARPQPISSTLRRWRCCCACCRCSPTSTRWC